MYGWIKHFADNTREVGTDNDVQRGRASWSKGRLEDMIDAEVFYGEKIISIISPGKFWQSDDYEVPLHGTEPKLVVRRLQRQLKEGETFAISIDHNSILAAGPVNLRQTWHCSVLVVTESMDGKWLTLEYNLERDRFTYRIEENKI